METPNDKIYVTTSEPTNNTNDYTTPWGKNTSNEQKQEQDTDVVVVTTDEPSSTDSKNFLASPWYDDIEEKTYVADSSVNVNDRTMEVETELNSVKFTEDNNITKGNKYTILGVDIPNYSSVDFILDRNNWQKQLTNIGGEIGFFYFKIFFKFDTNYGLLAATLPIMEGSQITSTFPVNGAIGYLYKIQNMYKAEQIHDRMLALYKFSNMLSHISTETPWFFKGVNNLNNIQSAFLTEQNKEKFIEINCLEDSVDARLGTLLDLYKFACFDNIRGKEIIPENLRKFDMCISIFNSPIKYYQTALTGNVDFKKFAPENNNWQNVISYKLFEFKNCEIDPSSLNQYYSSLSNETAFNLGKNNIKIKYDRVFEHRMDEWNSMMFGSDGFYYNNILPKIFYGKPDDYLISKLPINNDQSKRLNRIANHINLQSFSEYATSYLIKSWDDGWSIGNTSGKHGTAPIKSDEFTKQTILEKKLDAIKFGSIISGNIYRFDLGPGTKYFDKKISNIKNGAISGNLYGYDLGPGTKYFENKIKNLKHENDIIIPNNMDLTGEKNPFKYTPNYTELSIYSLGKVNAYKISEIRSATSIWQYINLSFKNLINTNVNGVKKSIGKWKQLVNDVKNKFKW